MSRGPAGRPGRPLPDAGAGHRCGSRTGAASADGVAAGSPPSRPATGAGSDPITFDEALSDLHRCTVPIMERLGVPGHVEAVGSRARCARWGSPATTGCATWARRSRATPAGAGGLATTPGRTARSRRRRRSWRWGRPGRCWRREAIGAPVTGLLRPGEQHQHEPRGPRRLPAPRLPGGDAHHGRPQPDPGRRTCCGSTAPSCTMWATALFFSAFDPFLTWPSPGGRGAG